MKSFAALAVLAISASALELKESEVVEEQVDVVVIDEKTDFIETFDVLPDAEVAVAMAQGTGRDHTDWSWHWEHMEAREDADIAREEVVAAEVGLAGAVGEYEDVLGGILSPQVEHQRNCQLHREEEINLYYQCTQGDINNYALHHFGGEFRSYPRWVEEYNVCIDHIHSAKTLHLDFHWSDGTVTLEPCDPQDHGSSVYINCPIDSPYCDGRSGEINVGFNPIVTVISANPLKPHEPCGMQEIPNWGGIWVETKGGQREAEDILMGNIVLDDSYTMRCYTISGTTDPKKGKMLETWDEPGERTYDVELRKDDRLGKNHCMIHTALHGTSFTQWISGVGENSMNMQINEEWRVTQEDGSEKYESKHNEVRVGSCTASADGTFTATKHMIPGVRVY